MLRNILMVCSVLLFCGNVFAAELLVQAKGHWKDSWDQAKVSSLTVEEKKQYNARIQVGDIVVIKPNGWEWGREENLPNYLIIKIPNISVEDAEYLITPVTDAEGNVLKKRKYQLPKGIVKQAMENGGVYTFPVNSQVINKIVEKSR